MLTLKHSLQRHMTILNTAKWWLALMVFIVFTASCQTTSLLSYDGGQARPENRLSLETGGPHLGNWETRDVILDYEYEKASEQLMIRGRVDLQSGNKKFPSIKRMWVKIHFLDQDGFILGTRQLWSSGFWVPMYLVNWNFDRAWTLPPETAMVAFSYDGTVGEQGPGHNSDGEGGGVDWDFWRGP